MLSSSSSSSSLTPPIPMERTIASDTGHVLIRRSRTRKRVREETDVKPIKFRSQTRKRTEQIILLLLSTFQSRSKENIHISDLYDVVQKFFPNVLVSRRVYDYLNLFRYFKLIERVEGKKSYHIIGRVDPKLDSRNEDYLDFITPILRPIDPSPSVLEGIGLIRHYMIEINKEEQEEQEEQMISIDKYPISRTIRCAIQSTDKDQAKHLWTNNIAIGRIIQEHEKKMANCSDHELFAHSILAIIRREKEMGINMKTLRETLRIELYISEQTKLRRTYDILIFLEVVGLIEKGTCENFFPLGRILPFF